MLQKATGVSPWLLGALWHERSYWRAFAPATTMSLASTLVVSSPTSNASSRTSPLIGARTSSFFSSACSFLALFEVLRPRDLVHELLEAHLIFDRQQRPFGDHHPLGYKEPTQSIGQLEAH
jgi:hypothetical protein